MNYLTQSCCNCRQEFDGSCCDEECVEVSKSVWSAAGVGVDQLHELDESKGCV